MEIGCEIEGSDGANRSAEQLRRIAEALRLPVDAFRDSSAIVAEIAQGSELLRLWSSLDREADRQRALQFVRALATGRTAA